MHKSILPEFQDFLISRNPAPERHVPYYALRVSKYLYFANGKTDMNADLPLERFLSALRLVNNTEGWQVRQAEDAVRLYLTHFLTEKGGSSASQGPAGWTDLSEILRELRDRQHGARILTQ